MKVKERVLRDKIKDTETVLAVKKALLNRGYVSEILNREVAEAGEELLRLKQQLHDTTREG